MKNDHKWAATHLGTVIMKEIMKFKETAKTEIDNAKQNMPGSYFHKPQACQTTIYLGQFLNVDIGITMEFRAKKININLDEDGHVTPN